MTRSGRIPGKTHPSRRSGANRVKRECAMKFQDRDAQLLETIHQYDGVVAKRQLKHIFWQGMSWRAMEKRLAKLHACGYVEWPSRSEWRVRPIPEPVCWLGWQGILWIASRRDLTVKSPQNPNENQFRQLEKELREGGIRWVREPRWIQLEHDLTVVDVRMKIEQDLRGCSNLNLKCWLPESAFRTDMDVLEYDEIDRAGNRKSVRKGICPDGYFEITDATRSINGTPAVGRFLLEVDMATHDNPSFGREKALPGYEYIKSPQFRNRFGYNSGRWLVVTTGQARMEHLLRQTSQSAGKGARVFFFTTIEDLMREDCLSAPIWRQPGEEKPVTLFMK